MSHCSNCRRELPGLETLCQQCYEAQYEQVAYEKPWWRRLHLQPRFQRYNLTTFCFIFAAVFIALRFDFPYFHARHMKTTETSAFISTLIACVAFFLEAKGKSASIATNPNDFAGKVDWRSLILLAAGEITVGLVLYALFSHLPMYMQLLIAVVAFVILKLNYWSSANKKSVGSLLRGITGLAMALFGIASRVTRQDVWLTLMLVSLTLLAGLILLDGREDFT